MKKEATRKEIREMIYNQTKPFCLIDIFKRIEAIKPANRSLILDVLDELYNEGLVSFEHLSEKQGNTEYAFVVLNDVMDIKKLVRK